MDLKQYKQSKFAEWNAKHEAAVESLKDHPKVKSYLSRIRDEKGLPQNIIAAAVRARIIPRENAADSAELQWSKFYGTEAEPGKELTAIVAGELVSEPLEAPLDEIAFADGHAVVPVMGGMIVSKKIADESAPLSQLRVSQAAVASGKWVRVEYCGEQVALSIHQAFEYGLRELSSEWRLVEAYAQE